MNNINKKYIGLLGGTFDPPHKGHESISKNALIKLNLQEIWWIVTYKNPLKKNSSDYKKRIEAVRKFLDCRRIKLMEIDSDKNLYTIDTISFLKRKFKTKNFIWLMGTDNLPKLHLWKDWKKIFYNIPIAIFDRPSYSLNISKSRALFFFKKARVKNNCPKDSLFMTPPKWIFINGLKNNQSSSYIRKINENKC